MFLGLCSKNNFNGWYHWHVSHCIPIQTILHSSRVNLNFQIPKINTVTASVKGRVGDDITQSPDDDGNVRNCSTLHIHFLLE